MAFTTETKFVEAAERRLGVRLPESFRQFLLRSNGGEIAVLDLDWDLNPVHDDSDRERNRRTAIDIVLETTSAREWAGFPQNAVSIGSDGCGNHLIFLPDDADSSTLRAALYVWWHEGPELQFVAEDFSVAFPGG
ncbi:MAG TPA: SMI1/KNR4 family protein [Thermoanaerobaculia bacterium]